VSEADKFICFIELSCSIKVWGSIRIIDVLERNLTRAAFKNWNISEILNIFENVM